MHTGTWKLISPARRKMTEADKGTDNEPSLPEKDWNSSIESFKTAVTSISTNDLDGDGETRTENATKDGEKNGPESDSVALKDKEKEQESEDVVVKEEQNEVKDEEKDQESENVVVKDEEEDVKDEEKEQESENVVVKDEQKKVKNEKGTIKGAEKPVSDKPVSDGRLFFCLCGRGLLSYDVASRITSTTTKTKETPSTTYNLPSSQIRFTSHR